MAANEKTKASGNYAKVAGWMIETAFRLIAGYVLVVGVKHNYITLVVGIYALATGTAIVIAHFVKAHK